MLLFTLILGGCYGAYPQPPPTHVTPLSTPLREGEMSLFAGTSLVTDFPEVELNTYGGGVLMGGGVGLKEDRDLYLTAGGFHGHYSAGAQLGLRNRGGERSTSGTTVGLAMTLEDGSELIGYGDNQETLETHYLSITPSIGLRWRHMANQHISIPMNLRASFSSVRGISSDSEVCRQALWFEAGTALSVGLRGRWQVWLGAQLMGTEYLNNGITPSDMLWYLSPNVGVTIGGSDFD